MIISFNPHKTEVKNTAYNYQFPHKTFMRNFAEKDIFVKSDKISFGSLDRKKLEKERQMVKIECKKMMPKALFKNVEKRGLFDIIPERGENQLKSTEIIFLSEFSDNKWDLVKKYGLLKRKTLQPYGIYGILSFLNEMQIQELDKIGFLDNLNFSYIGYEALGKFQKKDFKNFKKRNLKHDLKGIEIASLPDKHYKNLIKRNLLKNDIGFVLATLNDEQYKLYCHYKKFGKLKDFVIIDIVRNNKIWEKAIKYGVMDLFAKEKVSFETMTAFNDALKKKHTVLNPEVLSDIELLKQDKSVVPEFKKGTPKEEAFRQTKVGDAVQIGEKMYINDGEKLYPWKMTRQKYNNLFPPIERYMIGQGNLPNCFFISALKKCMSNPYSRAEIYKSFEVDGENIYCTIRAYKDFFGTKKYRDGLYLYEEKHLNGCKGLQILEQTYARCIMSKSKKISPKWDETFKPDVKKIMNRFKDGGYEADVMNELLGTTIVGVSDTNFNKNIIFSIKDIPKSINRFSATMNMETSKKEIPELIKRLANDNRYLLNITTNPVKTKEVLNNKYYILPYHSYAINGYDKKKDTITVENPHNPFISYKIPFRIFEKYIESLSITKFKSIPKNDKNSLYNLQNSF